MIYYGGVATEWLASSVSTGAAFKTITSSFFLANIIMFSTLALIFPNSYAKLIFNFSIPSNFGFRSCVVLTLPSVASLKMASMLISSTILVGRF